jgi:AraC-like DNA-binding protein
MNAQANAVAGALKLVEARLCAPLTVANMAEAAGYSLYHFVRTFNAVVRHTPYDYLMRRRLSHAAQRLLESDDRILEIALACQFGSHESFTRAFGRMFGLPPAAWRENGSCPPRCLMPALGPADLLFRSSDDFAPPEIVKLPPLHLAGWMQVLSDKPGDEASLAAAFRAALTWDPIPNADDDIWQVRVLPGAPGQAEILMIGAAVGVEADIPARYVRWSGKGGDSLCMAIPDYLDDPSPVLTYLHHTFLPRSGLRLAEPVEQVQSMDPAVVYLPLADAGMKS